MEVQRKKEEAELNRQQAYENNSLCYITSLIFSLLIGSQGPGRTACSPSATRRYPRFYYKGTGRTSFLRERGTAREHGRSHGCQINRLGK